MGEKNKNKMLHPCLAALRGGLVSWSGLTGMTMTGALTHASHCTIQRVARLRFAAFFRLH
jgi:hypothetical protein